MPTANRARRRSESTIERVCLFDRLVGDVGRDLVDDGDTGSLACRAVQRAVREHRAPEIDDPEYDEQEDREDQPELDERLAPAVLRSRQNGHGFTVTWCVTLSTPPVVRDGQRHVEVVFVALPFHVYACDGFCWTDLPSSKTQDPVEHVPCRCCDVSVKAAG